MPEITPQSAAPDSSVATYTIRAARNLATEMNVSFTLTMHDPLGRVRADHVLNEGGTMPLPEVLATLEGQAFGISLPLLSPLWTDNGLFNTKDDDMTLSNSGNWLAPMAGLCRVVDASRPIGVTLIKPDGTAETGPGVLLSLFPQEYLRLARLYAQELEQTQANRPERGPGRAAPPRPQVFLLRRCRHCQRQGRPGPGERRLGSHGRPPDLFRGRPRDRRPRGRQPPRAADDHRPRRSSSCSRTTRRRRRRSSRL